MGQKNTVSTDHILSPRTHHSNLHTRDSPPDQHKQRARTRESNIRKIARKKWRNFFYFALYRHTMKNIIKSLCSFFCNPYNDNTTAILAQLHAGGYQTHVFTDKGQTYVMYRHPQALHKVQERRTSHQFQKRGVQNLPTVREQDSEQEMPTSETQMGMYDMPRSVSL
jgi:hypothetical protein